MKLAIVILNWNGFELLERFLPKVIRNSCGAMVAVIDNDSTDGSVEMLKKKFPEIKIVRNHKNYGYAKGYNEGLKSLKADIFCLLNSDVEVTSGWLFPVMETFKRQPQFAAIQPKILDMNKRDTFEYAGAGGGLLDFFGYPYCRGRLLNRLEKDNGQYDDTKPVFWASGACFFIRSSVFWDLGGFDEDFFAYQEEIDLCWRLHHKHYSVGYVGASEVYHLGSESFGEISLQKTFFNFRNSLISITKNMPDVRVWFVIFTRLILDGIAGCVFLVKCRPKHSLAIVKAHFHYYKNLKKTLKKRRSINKRCFKYYGRISIFLRENTSKRSLH